MLWTMVWYILEQFGKVWYMMDNGPVNLLVHVGIICYGLVQFGAYSWFSQLRNQKVKKS